MPSGAEHDQVTTSAGVLSSVDVKGLECGPGHCWAPAEMTKSVHFSSVVPVGGRRAAMRKYPPPGRRSVKLSKLQSVRDGISSVDHVVEAKCGLQSLELPGTTIE